MIGNNQRNWKELKIIGLYYCCDDRAARPLFSSYKSKKLFCHIFDVVLYNIHLDTIVIVASQINPQFLLVKSVSVERKDNHFYQGVIDLVARTLGSRGVFNANEEIQIALLIN